MSVEASVNDRPGALPKIYLAMIFDSSAEGVQLEAEMHVNLETLKESVQRIVHRRNHDRDLVIENFAWDGNTFYPIDKNVKYGDFYWARIQEIHPGVMFSISEFA